MNLPLARPFRIARGERTVAENVLVEIEFEGVVGRGEAAPNVRYGQSQESSLAALRSFELPAGLSPFELEEILEAFRRHAPEQRATHTALQSALWDWTGQRLGQPVSELLGLSAPDREPPPSSWTISIDEPQNIEARVEEAADWPIFKVKLGGGDADVVAIETLRRVSAAPIRVDANEAWTEEEALEKIPWLAARGCELVEQPLPAADLDGATRLKESSPLPLVADEAVLDEASVSGLARAYHGINVKLMKTGGLTEAIRLIHSARGHGMDVLVGCFVESGLGIAAAAVLSPLARWLDLDGAALLSRDPFEGCRVENGRIRRSGSAGLGVWPRPLETN
jgi:L-alanine-DL-glutamate epimerase-like enolase superfamily enzyme